MSKRVGGAGPWGVGRVFWLLPMLALALTACSQEGEKAMQRPPVPVSMALAVGKPMPVQVLAIGRVEAYATVSVTSQVDGELRDVHFKEGQVVKAGDRLFTIDTRTYQAALDQAQANMERDQAQLKEYRQEMKRNKTMAERQFISQQDYDKIVAQAEAQEAVVKADAAAVESAQLKLQYCRIDAPIGGRTGSYLINRGNVVHSGSDQALVVIKQTHPCYVSMAVPEQHLAQIKEYLGKGGPLKMEAFLAPPAKLSEKGVLTFVDNQVDKDTGTVVLKGTFNNEQDNLWPGQFVNAALTLTVINDAVVVPSRAVQTGPQGLFVFVVGADNKVEARPVVQGESLAEETRIAQGLKVGEKVVTDGHLALYPGAAVVEKTLATPAPAPGGGA